MSIVVCLCHFMLSLNFGTLVGFLDSVEALASSTLVRLTCGMCPSLFLAKAISSSASSSMEFESLAEPCSPPPPRGGSASLFFLLNVPVGSGDGV